MCGLQDRVIATTTGPGRKRTFKSAPCLCYALVLFPTLEIHDVEFLLAPEINAASVFLRVGIKSGGEIVYEALHGASVLNISDASGA